MVHFENTHRNIFLPRYRSLVILMFQKSRALGIADPTRGMTAAAAEGMNADSESPKMRPNDAVAYDLQWFEANGRRDKDQMNLQIEYRIGGTKYRLITVGFDADERPHSIEVLGKWTIEKGMIQKLPPQSVNPPHTGISLPPPGNANQILPANAFNDYQNKGSDYQNKPPGRQNQGSDYQNKK